MSNCGYEIEIKSKEESRVLIILLLINAGMFITEFAFGWLSESTGLIANSLDMFADALVYGAGLYAVGKSLRIKANSAMLSGCFISAIVMRGGVQIIKESKAARISLFQ